MNWIDVQDMNELVSPAMGAETRSVKLRAENEDEILLGVLSAVHDNSVLTQRTVARDLGIALGLANAYLKRCTRKGYIKIKQIPRRRFAYYLTPAGFSEKARLTAKYLTDSFHLFRRARNECTALLESCAAAGRLRVVLVGLNELADVVALCAPDRLVEVVGIVAPGASGNSYLSYRVVQSLEDLPEIDAAIVVDARTPAYALERLIESLGPNGVLAPPVLKMNLPSTASRRAVSP